MLTTLPSLPTPSPTRTPLSLHLPSNQRRRWCHCSSLRIGPEEISQLVHNKVLLAAALSSAVGQLSKPFTAAVRGHGFDLLEAGKSGGMPSTHSASVVAAATSLGLERGFSDSVFGMSVVIAAIVMYDAQGVRREVGRHSKAFNRLLMIQEKVESELEMETSTVDSEKSTSSSILGKSIDISGEKSLSSIVSEKTPLTTSKLKKTLPSFGAYRNATSMNERVGHTKLQVIIGAMLGFLVSLTIESIL